MKRIALLALVGCNQLLGNHDFSAPADAPPAREVDAYVDPCVASGRPATSLSGTVYAPNGTLPLYGATVYVPSAPLAAIRDGVGGPTCTSGAPIAITHSDEAGHFQLVGVPSGDVPLVVQVGKWRREQVVVHGVAACTDNPVDPDAARLPRDAAEGTLPHIAITTGDADTLECIARDIGVDPTEIGSGPAFGGHVHLYVENGVSKLSSGTALDPSTQLYADDLARYDMIMFGCTGQASMFSTPVNATSVETWTDSGGWLFLEHYQWSWLVNAPGPWSAIAQFGSGTSPDAGVLSIDTTTPIGTSFARWLVHVGVSTVTGQVPLSNARNSCIAVGPSAVRQMYLDPALDNGTSGVQSFTYDTPGGGRVTFDDVHANGGVANTNLAYPAECGPPLAQEIAMIFQVFEMPTCQ
ncbi:MAG TPA: hypothetical protein VLX92_31330 [Kofleriaceae bacterium]|nr:hypothetical protein [Kofleriaceae bacterium]